MRWIIGDVHGMFAPLEALLEEVSRADAGARLYFLGDYINRGPDSKRVLDLLIPLKAAGARFVRGNHDDNFDEVLNGESYASNAANSDRVVAFQWFMEHGLDATFESYGVDYAMLEHCQLRPSVERLDQIVSAVPAAHKQFIRDLTPLIDDADLFVAHAMWDPHENDLSTMISRRLESDGQARHKLLWGRFAEDEISCTKAWRRTGYFGHTPVFAYAASQTSGEVAYEPVAGNQMVLIDTGCALSQAGRLTAYCAEESRFVQADRFGKIVKPRP
jgi:serine/threonine protein phosphatase 1